MSILSSGKRHETFQEDSQRDWPCRRRWRWSRRSRGPTPKRNCSPIRPRAGRRTSPQHDAGGRSGGRAAERRRDPVRHVGQPDRRLSRDGVRRARSGARQVAPGRSRALVAADLEARPITDKLLTAGSAELQAAVEKLRGELPLGSTDMEAVLQRGRRPI